MIRIGLIDSGVSGPAAQRVIAAADFPRGMEREIGTAGTVVDELGHGTRMAEIIGAHAPAISLVSARVFFGRLVTTPAQVAAALDWLLEQEVRLVNMSFGLAADRLVLALACRRALDAGVLLVAAAPARGDPVYPAAYPGVIRATGDARCAPGEISWLNAGQADFGGHVRSGDGTMAGASIGCAWVSAVMAAMQSVYPGSTSTELVDLVVAEAAYRGAEQHGA